MQHDVEPRPEVLALLVVEMAHHLEQRPGVGRRSPTRLLGGHSGHERRDGFRALGQLAAHEIETHGGAGQAARPAGSHTRNVAPPRGWFSAEMSPPCASTIERLMVSPMPSPSDFVVKNGSKSRDS